MPPATASPPSRHTHVWGAGVYTVVDTQLCMQCALSAIAAVPWCYPLQMRYLAI